MMVEIMECFRMYTLSLHNRGEYSLLFRSKKALLFCWCGYTHWHLIMSVAGILTETSYHVCGRYTHRGISSCLWWVCGSGNTVKHGYILFCHVIKTNYPFQNRYIFFWNVVQKHLWLRETPAYRPLTVVLSAYCDSPVYKTHMAY